jgi:tetratricopeptide (TPR) repeat protein
MSYPAYLEAAAALGYLHVWFRRDPARGLKTMAAALARYPLDSIAVLKRPYLTLAFLYASAGQPQRARALLGMYERGVDPELRRIHEPRLRWVWGQVALAEGRFADAIGEFRAYLPSPRDCLPCGHATLARAYDGAGNADSALALYERYLAIPSADRLNESHLFEDDATQLGPACKRLGELYEQRGERDKATEYYRRFVALWQEADPELRPAVGEITQRLRQ